MVMLFLALCREAGIPVKDAPRERSGRSSSSSGKTSSKKGSEASSATRRRSPPDDGRGHTPATSSTAGLLFGVTEDDIGVLNDEQFATVWTALGTVARARAQARRDSAATDRSADDAEQALDEGQV